MKTHLHKIALPLARLYWRIFKPKTYGVKVIVQHPHTNEILVVQHTYGVQKIWHLPGGGYRPNQESPESAAKREIKEELGPGISNLEALGEYKTSAEGKRDTVIIFLGKAQSTNIIPSSEIAAYCWITPQTFVNMKHIYKVSKFAMHLLKQKEAG